MMPRVVKELSAQHFFLLLLAPQDVLEDEPDWDEATRQGTKLILTSPCLSLDGS